MGTFIPFDSWIYARNYPGLGLVPAEVQEEALGVLVASINAGTVLDFDGVGSMNGRALREKHGHDCPIEMNWNWKGSPQGWLCPCCGRSKVEISRLGSKGQILAKLVVHHDHMNLALRRAFHTAFEVAGTDVEQAGGAELVTRIAAAFAAYTEVLVCEDCNNADGDAKRALGLPSDFSFVVSHIRSFIRPVPHRPHQIDQQAALATWELAKPAFALRMRIILAIAKAAATDRHWYEPHQGPGDPVPVYGRRRGVSGDLHVGRWIPTDSLEKALGPVQALPSRNLARWRTEARPRGRTLPKNYVALLRSNAHDASRWDEVPQEWRCPTCKRSKYEVTYVGAQGQIIFLLSRTPGRRIGWPDAVCNHCFSVLASLKLELSEYLDLPISFAHLTPDTLSSILLPAPHSPHSVRPRQAAELVDQIVQDALDS